MRKTIKVVAMAVPAVFAAVAPAFATTTIDYGSPSICVPSLGWLLVVFMLSGVISGVVAFLGKDRFWVLLLGTFVAVVLEIALVSAIPKQHCDYGVVDLHCFLPGFSGLLL
ncbi:hypothetical protein G7K71_14115 [Desulfofundulus sp. TPOSR]|uniref:hypothetical protein n=1 Tax=Desulfofundulus sp. TPOSR TaxID=2714340 RepID=UPI001407C542|nr:hypothetical protein [Desulfofundulus sp. TPOSR]NHM28094.1 hypothetical protein [Desulfofundulus sp. TPOSR]